MPNWSEVLKEIQEEIKTGNNNSLDTVRRKYLSKIEIKTGRNVIAYYSGWLQKPNSNDSAINDKDKSSFMATIHGLDRSKGLDLILHTPGGDLAATESIIDYLNSMFNYDIRTIIPQISMSAGTMLALSSKEIMMGKQSNLGPIDPQMGGIACQAVIDEFNFAKNDIKNNPHAAVLWQAIISKYHPTFLIACQQAIEWSKNIAKVALLKNMCKHSTSQVDKILSVFADHSVQKSHSRHISLDECKNAGLKIIEMESDNELQDLILTTHHAFMHTLSHSSAIKIVENHLGIAVFENILQNK
jgi:ATP-dependent protease ClpP protease subunit